MLKISLRRFLLLGAGLLGICLAFLLSQAVLALASPLQSASQTAQNSILLPDGIPSPTPPVPRAYLPLIINRGSGGIFGFVTQDGKPAGNVRLNLRMTGPGGTVVVGTAITDPKGYYQFINADTLGTGQAYQVVYDGYNPLDSTPGRLAWWKTKIISIYTNSQTVNIGNFDIQDVAQINPPSSNTALTLPVTFSWVRRVHAPTDSYQFKIVDYSGVPKTYTEQFASPALGYLDHFIFQTSDWQTGMTYDYINYYWYLAVQAPDGGTGVSHFIWNINFLSSP